ncbi:MULTISPECIES: hypothetical protein [Pseudomonas syringae group]|uniref:hypothetical protein n=1 Tax=Pseudomonas syringae group TaxID=136849 RepID=UPI000A6AF642|nr:MULTISPECIES: hypothetical protein [Pseudomonas syringae group]
MSLSCNYLTNTASKAIKAGRPTKSFYKSEDVKIPSDHSDELKTRDLMVGFLDAPTKSVGDQVGALVGHFFKKEHS